MLSMFQVEILYKKDVFRTAANSLVCQALYIIFCVRWPILWPMRIKYCHALSSVGPIYTDRLLNRRIFPTHKCCMQCCRMSCVGSVYYKMFYTRWEQSTQHQQHWEAGRPGRDRNIVELWIRRQNFSIVFAKQIYDWRKSIWSWMAHNELQVPNFSPPKSMSYYKTKFYFLFKILQVTQVLENLTDHEKVFIL